MKRVVLLQRVLPHYRISFVEALAIALAGRGVALELVYGQARRGDAPQSAEFDAPWARRIHNHYLPWPEGAVWQPARRAMAGADLVIVEQANSALINYGLMARLFARGARIAYWGHGRNWQSARPDGVLEHLKRRMLTAADWWFAYTERAAAVVAGEGFPGDRITTVNNTIDTRGMQSPATRARTAPRAIYCGSLRTDKRLGFLVAAADLVRAAVPDFELVVIGDGPERPLIVEAAASRSWLRHLGALQGEARTRWFHASRVQLMPGLVGLAIIDSLATATPLITTEIPTHSPEIAYLEPGENGLITENSVEAYAAAVVRVLSDPKLEDRLVGGCLRSAEHFTLEAMVDRFTTGVVECLAQPPMPR